MSRPLILVTNDDGYDAPGLGALARAMGKLGEVLVVAPDRERSGASHALTLDRPLRISRFAEGRYRVTGTPTDCVHLAIDSLTGGRLPALVASGINRGLNIGDDVTYSGTVAGAMEGALLHVPGLAMSSEADPAGKTEYEQAVRVAARMAGRLLEHGIEDGCFLNVNVPVGELRGVRVTRQGTRRYRATAVERHDPSGRPYYWIDSVDMTPTGEPDGDHAAIRDGYVSVTPLHANLTHDTSLATIAGWDLGLD